MIRSVRRIIMSKVRRSIGRLIKAGRRWHKIYCKLPRWPPRWSSRLHNIWRTTSSRIQNFFSFQSFRQVKREPTGSTKINSVPKVVLKDVQSERFVGCCLTAWFSVPVSLDSRTYHQERQLITRGTPSQSQYSGNEFMMSWLCYGDGSFIRRCCLSSATKRILTIQDGWPSLLGKIHRGSPNIWHSPISVQYTIQTIHRLDNYCHYCDALYFALGFPAIISLAFFGLILPRLSRAAISLLDMSHLAISPPMRFAPPSPAHTTDWILTVRQPTMGTFDWEE